MRMNSGEREPARKACTRWFGFCGSRVNDSASGNDSRSGALPKRTRLAAAMPSTLP